MSGRPKREVVRPYPPDFVSAETLAYRLDIGRSTVDDWVKVGLLPQPLTVGTRQRWRWSDVEAAITAANHPLAREGANGSAEENDPFSQGAQNVATAHA
jgi:predicted DNA-binding transcriptional regulator AlpA